VTRIDIAKASRIGSSAVYAVFCLLLIIGSFARPLYDWDLLPYVAIAIEDRHATNPAELHRATYDLVRSRVKDDQWRALVGGNTYRVEQAENAESFQSQLGMYRIKLGYKWALQAVSRWVDPVIATVVVSVASAVAIAAAIGLFLVSRGFSSTMALAVPALMAAGLPAMARSSQPDALFSMFLIGGFIAFIAGRHWPASLLFVLSVIVRPDNVVFMALLVPAALLYRIDWRPYALGLTASVAAYLFATTGADHPGWWRHFVFSVVELQPTLVGFDPPLSLRTYLLGLVESTVKTLSWHLWLWLSVAIAFAAVYFKPIRERMQGHLLAGCLAVFASLILKFLIFPLPDDRIYFAYMVCAALIVLDTLRINPVRADAAERRSPLAPAQAASI
jgi:hypothetical protein